MSAAKLTLLPAKPAVKQKPPFEQVFEQHYARALTYIRGKIGNEQDAEDLCSEAFFYCYNQYDTYDPEKSSVSTWLYLVINSRIKNYYRDHKSHADIDELQNILPDEGSDMDRAIYLQQLRSVLADAVSTLPERQQRIVILHYFHNKSSQEIAEELDMTPGNVRVQLSRALDKLEGLCQDFR